MKNLNYYHKLSKLKGKFIYGKEKFNCKKK